MTNAGAEYAEDPILPKLRKRGLSLAGVMPLLQYLDHELVDNREERPLTEVEDAKAIAILKTLVPKDDHGLQICVDDFCNPANRESRSLVHWYIYIKHVAAHFDGTAH